MTIVSQINTLSPALHPCYCLFSANCCRSLKEKGREINWLVELIQSCKTAKTLTDSSAPTVKAAKQGSKVFSNLYRKKALTPWLKQQRSRRQMPMSCSSPEDKIQLTPMLARQIFAL